MEMTMEVLVTVLVAACSLALPSSAQRESYVQLGHYSTDYPLPNLPFGYDELEPYLDTPTLRVHHLGHHRAYTDKMNAALRQWRKAVSQCTAPLSMHLAYTASNRIHCIHRSRYEPFPPPPPPPPPPLLFFNRMVWPLVAEVDMELILCQKCYFSIQFCPQ